MSQKYHMGLSVNAPETCPSNLQEVTQISWWTISGCFTHVLGTETRIVVGPFQDQPRTYLGCFIVVRDRQHITKRLLIAVNRLVSNSPLQVSVYLAVEMVKAAYVEATATWAQNYFRKARCRT